MIRNILLLCLVWMLALTGASGQDTITLMHWNLLNYGNTTTYCTQTNNSITAKAAAMGVVTTYVNPQILTVNEIGANSFAPAHFLNNVLNINGANWYQGSAMTNLSSSDLANFVFYDSRKFVLHSQYQIATTQRDINIVKLYHNDTNLPFHQDTAFLYVIVTHLKAGTTSADATERGAMAKIIMDSAARWSDGPAVLCGDMNLYTATELAWKNLTQPADTTGEVFYDPVNMIGAWQDNQNFAAVHTQSTHSTSNGCAASGGLDDRFDFILMNKKLRKYPVFYTYIPGSYKSLGNDGNHLNQAINAGTNSSVPAIILQNLYDASDHLPVIMKLQLTPSTQGQTIHRNVSFERIICKDHQIEFFFTEPAPLREIDIYDLSGRLIAKSIFSAQPETTYLMPLPSELKTGCYILTASDNNGEMYRTKLLLNP
jgi:hypothetical protein